MKRFLSLFGALLFAANAFAGEVLFTKGPQEYQGTRYYWLAEWKLEVTIPKDVKSDEAFEVLFGTKGKEKRTLYFEYKGKPKAFSNVRNKPYDWVKLPLGDLEGGAKIVLFGKGRQNVGFLAGVRTSRSETSPPQVKPVRTSEGQSSEGVASWSEIPGFVVNEDMKRLWNPSPSEADWDRAERSSVFAGIALDKVQRWLHERCMGVHDRRTGLFRPTGSEWNYWDTAADCYPFYVWAAFYTDQDLLEGVMVDALEAEQRLCNCMGRLPVPYDMDALEQKKIDFDRMVFGASEYVKDGLVPIVEITGKEYPWYERMRGIVDDLFSHAKVATTYGKIPSKNVEVNGELLQILPRLYRMTGEEKYLEWAHRLADYYLLKGGFVPTRLSDHGCEIIGGLGLLFAVDCDAAPEKAKQYRPHMEYMFDEVLRRGTNSDGIIVKSLQEREGPHDAVGTKDGWGYDFVGFMDYDLALGMEKYQQPIRKAISNLLNDRYFQYNWGSGSRDDIADSVEGGLYLLFRSPMVEGFVWADREIATVLVDHAKLERLWGTHKLEANTVRTVLIHTMLHTRNVIARPWQQGLRLGAAPCGEGICLFLKSEKAYEGRLQFDIPRHRLTIGFKQDWPRMNALPEWFTVEPDEEHLYSVTCGEHSEGVSGAALRQGYPVRLEPNEALRIQVMPGTSDF